MPYLSLTLLGFPVDLPPDAQVALSYRANDLRTLDSREAPFSETFTLPFTAQNVAVLGSPHSLDSGTTTPYRLLPAVLTSPGGTVLLDGFGILARSHEGYDLTLTDALGGLFASVGDRTLQDLDLRHLDHALSLASVAAARNHTAADGYVYALADDGRLTRRDPAVGVLYYELPACVYYDALVRAMLLPPLPPVGSAAGGFPYTFPFALGPPVGYVAPVNPLAGYHLTGSLLAEDRYQRAVVLPAGPYPRVRALELAYTTATGRVVTARVYPGQASGYFIALQFPQLTQDPGGRFFAGIDYIPPPYTCDLTVHISLRATVRHAPGQPVAGDFVALHLQDATKTTGDANSLAGRYDARRIYQGAINAQPTDISCDYEVTLAVLTPDGLPRIALYLFADVGAEVTILPGSSLRFSPAPRTYAGGPVHLDAGLPAMKQADLLKGIFNQCNVLVQTDAVLKTIRFDLLNDLERNRNRAVDWSDKLDLTRRPRLAYALGDYAQANALAYADAPKEYAQQLGTTDLDNAGGGLLYVANATLPARATAYQAPVLLPQPHPALGGLSLIWRPLLADVVPVPGVLTTRAALLWTPAIGYDENSPRLLYGGLAWRALQNVTQGSPAPDARFPQTWVPAPYDVLNESLAAVALVAPLLPGPPAVRGDYPDTGTFPLSFGLTRAGLGFADLLSDYYPGLQAMLSRVQLLSVDVRLNAIDIATLDFTRPVRLLVPHWPGYGRLDCLAYLNLIDQFIPGSPGAVAVTLVVLGEPVPSLAPKVPNPKPATRRALATETGHLLTTEDGLYILLEI